jgi:Asp-tRNA(Asn)/Glu-tRNA(Gln) amidotransferase A subunit family amidase
MVRFAYGTQTVGSIIRPAAYCGVVGYKPSYGMLSRTGMKMGAESLDTAGVIARNVEDAALLAGASAMRSDLLQIRSSEKPRLGLCRSPNWHHMSPEGARAFEDSVKRLGARGAKVVETDMRFDKLDEAASTILVYEMARGLAYEIANHRAQVAPMLLERVAAGATMPYAKYAEAQAYAADCRRRLADLGDVDAILTPSATGEAPLGLGSTGNTAMNRLWTLLHGPCVTLPAGSGPAGLPLGVQLVGIPGSDAKTLAVARWVEHSLV